MSESIKPEQPKKATIASAIEQDIFVQAEKEEEERKRQQEEKEEERKRQQEKEAIIAKQKAEREAQKAAEEAQKVAEEAERKKKADCEELIQEAIRLKNAGEYNSAKKKLDKARKMNVVEKSETINTIEKEVIRLKSENSFWGNISKKVTKAIETVLDEDKND